MNGYPAQPAAPVRVRFAPSPTGPLHAGNVRTAIFNWLFARRHSGQFILRIEDTDRERSKPEFAEEIEESLKWLGLAWDEGPYYQSQHGELYSKVVQKLLSAGNLYPCFCSKEQLEADRAEFVRRSAPPVYVRRCRDIPPDTAKERMENEPFALRFRVEGKELAYLDPIRGEMKSDLTLMGDFIVVRSDQTATYNLAAAADDGMMRITHVIRGEDHISNTPAQMLIMDALGFDRPVYAHLPLIMADDGTKLSKRHADSRFAVLRERGYLPEAVLNFLTLIGWTPDDSQEDMSEETLIKKFSLDRVAVRSAHYNLDKLDWLNRRKTKTLPIERLAEYAGEHIKIYREPFFKLSEEDRLALLSAVRENLDGLDTLDRELLPFFEYEFLPQTKVGIKNYRWKEVAQALLHLCDTDEFRGVTKALTEATGLKGKELFMPLRAALSGRLHGPELKHLYAFLTPDDRRERVKKLLAFMKG